MTVVDGATGRTAMLVRSIAEAAGLSVDEYRDCRFSRWRPHPGREIFDEDDQRDARYG
jgi:hypothetical protein